MLKESLGIATTIVEEEYRVFLESRHDKTRWDLARLGWTADYNDASNFLDVFREHSSNNDSGYSNAKFDSLLDKAANAADPIERRHLLEVAEKTMLDDYAIVPLYFYVSKRLAKPYVKGIESNPLNRLSSANLVLEPH
jgi:oligopeptide transport system substrate-binding protein